MFFVYVLLYALYKSSYYLLITQSGKFYLRWNPQSYPRIVFHINPQKLWEHFERRLSAAMIDRHYNVIR